MVTIRTNPELLEHLRSFNHDGATVDSLLFEGGRLSYPGRKEIEYQLGYIEPYTLELEARVIEGLPSKMVSAIRLLSREVLPQRRGLEEELDPTLELLWAAHDAAWTVNPKGVSPDRLVAALVMVEYMVQAGAEVPDTFDEVIMLAAETLVSGLHSIGFPPTRESLEELFDGAPPACVGLGLVDL